MQKSQKLLQLIGLTAVATAFVAAKDNIAPARWAADLAFLIT